MLYYIILVFLVLPPPLYQSLFCFCPISFSLPSLHHYLPLLPKSHPLNSIVYLLYSASMPPPIFLFSRTSFVSLLAGLPSSRSSSLPGRLSPREMSECYEESPRVTITYSITLTHRHPESSLTVAYKSQRDSVPHHLLSALPPDWIPKTSVTSPDTCLVQS